jgi:hypothetical protein
LGWRLAELAAEQDKQDPVFFLNESWTVIHDKVELGSPGVSSGIVVAAAGNTPGKEVNSDTGKIDFARNATPAKDVLAALDTKPGLNDYPGASDSKFLHAEVERQAIHSQTRCRIPGSRKNPSGFFQDRAGMLTLDICESFELFALVSGCKAGLKVSARHVQYGTRRQNYHVLYHILEFAYISWPSVLNERVHRSRRGGISRLVHLSRRYFNKMLHEERNMFGPLA